MTFDLESWLDRARRLRALGASDEDLLRLIRQEGGSRVDSIRLFLRLDSIPMREAQKLIHESETWEDFKEGHEELQGWLVEALRDLADEFREEPEKDGSGTCWEATITLPKENPGPKKLR